MRLMRAKRETPFGMPVGTNQQNEGKPLTLTKARGKRWIGLSNLRWERHSRRLSSNWKVEHKCLKLDFNNTRTKFVHIFNLNF